MSNLSDETIETVTTLISEELTEHSESIPDFGSVIRKLPWLSSTFRVSVYRQSNSPRFGVFPCSDFCVCVDFDRCVRSRDWTVSMSISHIYYCNNLTFIHILLTETK